MSDSDSSGSNYEFSIDNIPSSVLNLNYYFVCIYTFSAWLNKFDNDLYKGLTNWIPKKDIQDIFKQFFSLSKRTLRKLNIDCVEYMRIQIIDIFKPLYYTKPMFLWLTLTHLRKYFIPEN